MLKFLLRTRQFHFTKREKGKKESTMVKVDRGEEKVLRLAFSSSSAITSQSSFHPHPQKFFVES